ncbi:hypothetical protein ASF18_12680 [Methylobacterium sp. Leaf89]|nr:hypothetical protein ASF18_12680 [Methylobacterium sp. Leaf89]
MPAECRLRLGRISEQHFDFRRTEKLFVDYQMIRAREADVPECNLTHFTDCHSATGRDYIIIRRVLLQHHPHRTDVIFCMPPVTLRIDIAETKFLGKPELDPSHAISDLPRDELHTAQR